MIAYRGASAWRPAAPYLPSTSRGGQTLSAMTSAYSVFRPGGPDGPYSYESPIGREFLEKTVTAAGAIRADNEAPVRRVYTRVVEHARRQCDGAEWPVAAKGDDRDFRDAWFWASTRHHARRGVRLRSEENAGNRDVRRPRRRLPICLDHDG